jgi:hypothetical protein
MKTPLIAVSVIAYTALTVVLICYAELTPALNPTF